MSDNIDVDEIQEQVCREYNAAYLEAGFDTIIGVADNVDSALMPLNGFRINPTDTTNGWFIWAGEEYSEDEDFFKPMHLGHLAEKHPEILPYLGLAPGWRFLISPSEDYEDVWRDDEILQYED